MFVRFRLTSTGRLNVALAENKRVDGRVQQSHVAQLGSIHARLLDVTQSNYIPKWELHSLRARVAFWDLTNDRLGRLSNRLGPDLKRIRIAVHRRVPWPMEPERNRLASLEADVEAKQWFGLYEMTKAEIERIDKQIAAATERKQKLVAEGTGRLAAANKALAHAREGGVSAFFALGEPEPPEGACTRLTCAL